MTKKDYVAIAILLSEYNQNCKDTISGKFPATDEARRSSVNEIFAIEVIAKGLADLMQTDNPNFDRARFLKVCGVEAE